MAKEPRQDGKAEGKPVNQTCGRCYFIIVDDDSTEIVAGVSYHQLEKCFRLTRAAFVQAQGKLNARLPEAEANVIYGANAYGIAAEPKRKRGRSKRK